MNINSKIYIAGHTGLVGSALYRNLTNKGYNNIVTISHKDLDLRNSHRTEIFFSNTNPEYVFLAAAKVGGIYSNSKYPVEFLLDNLRIQNNIIEYSTKYNIKKLLFLGSSCIYPKFAPQPLKEEYLLAGTLEPTNEAYAIAKIAGIKLCEAYNKEYNTNFISVMPTNLYGPGDRYDLLNAHVLPTLIRKFYLAKLASENNWEAIDKDAEVYGDIPSDTLISLKYESGPIVRLWGTGNSRREFLHVDDMAEACVHIMVGNYKDKLMNIGYSEDISIRELADLISSIVGFKGIALWDILKPDGTPQKLLDSSKLYHLGWKPKISLIEGIKQTLKDYTSKL